MALIFGNVDFESGTIGNSLANGSSGFDTAIGTTKPIYVASTRGSVAMRAATGGTADFPSMVELFTGGLRSVACIRFYAKMSTAVQFFALQLQTEAAIRAILRVNTDGSIRCRSGSASLGAADVGSGAINSSTWTRVEWLVTATAQQCRLFTGANVEGTTADFDTGSLSWTPAGTFDRFVIGIVSTTANVSIDYDDVAVDDTAWVGPTAGGNLTASPADAVGATDSITLSQSLARALADTLGATDSVANVLTAFRTQADPVGITDAVTAVVSAVRTISDSATISDLPGPQLLEVSEVMDDPAGVSDAVSSLMDAARTIADAVGVTDSATATLIAQTELADPVGVTDAAATTTAAIRGPSDGAGVADQVTITVSLAREANDPVGVSDSVSAILTAAGESSVSDPVGVVDAVAATVSADRTMDDAVGLFDSVTAILSVSSEQADAVSVSDAVGTITIMVRSMADGVAVSDTVTATLTRAELSDTPATRRLVVEYESRTLYVPVGE